MVSKPNLMMIDEGQSDSRYLGRGPKFAPERAQNELKPTDGGHTESQSALEDKQNGTSPNAATVEPAAISNIRQGSEIHYLRLGSNGEEVRWLRQELSAWLATLPDDHKVKGQLEGKPFDTESTTFDEQLDTLVRAFQRERGLKVDGIVGFRTLFQLDTVAIDRLGASGNTGEAQAREEKRISTERYHELEQRARKAKEKFSSPPAAPSVSSNEIPNLPYVYPKDAEFLFNDASPTDSLVAVAIGVAEGTRTPNGGKTKHYYGHVDPGNGVWNYGSFSVQSTTHGVYDPIAADRYFHKKLREATEEFFRVCELIGIEDPLSQRGGAEILLACLDLYVQAPLCNSGINGFVSEDNLEGLRRLFEIARTGSHRELTLAIIKARVESFRDNHGILQAGGFGNDLGRLTLDQERRTLAILGALAQHAAPAESDVAA